MTAASRPASRSRADLQALSVVQLHQLAERGSRSARAELERRMADPLPAPASRAGAPRPTGRDVQTREATPPAPAPAGAEASQALIEQWALIERQQSAQARSTGLPRLMGWVLILWGALLGFGGLVLLARGGGAYYLACGAACAAVGALLARRSRWAMTAHGVLALVALGWAWRGGSVTLALVQAAPVLIAALWMALPGMREALD